MSDNQLACQRCGSITFEIKVTVHSHTVYCSSCKKQFNLDVLKGELEESFYNFLHWISSKDKISTPDRMNLFWLNSHEFAVK